MIDFLIVLIVASDIFSFSSLISIFTISSISSLFLKFKSSDNSLFLILLSLLFLSLIFFLVISLNSISSSILFSLFQSLFFIDPKLSFCLTFPIHHFFSISNSCSSYLLFILFVTIISIYHDFYFFFNDFSSSIVFNSVRMSLNFLIII